MEDIEMSRRLEGKTAVITGGTSGIGEASAEVFAAEGARVVIAGRSEEKGQKIAGRLGENVFYKRTDVTIEDDIKAMIDFAVEKFGTIDCLFNNAGGLSRGDLETVTPDDFDYSMRLLLGSVVFGIKHVVPLMKKNKSGCIINNSSIAALRNNQGFYLYSAAKAAVTHLTKVAGNELGRFGIRVNSISPGAVATPIFWGGSEVDNLMDDEASAKKLEKLKRNLSKATALGISGLPEDIAKAALYLASEDSRFVTCLDLVVDGGRIWQYHEAS